MCETKKCSHCGRELPLTMFGKCAASADGLQSWYNPCKAEFAREKYAKKKAAKAKVKEVLTATPPDTNSIEIEGKVYHRIESKSLSDYSPRELLAELKLRGYVWDNMWIKQKISWEKI